MNLEGISPGNPALIYLSRRLHSDDYRGNHISQHNRYDMERVCLMLKTLDKYCGSRRLTIRNTDTSRRPSNTPEEAAYARFCSEVKGQIGTGTQDSMRKNYFVDFERMGLLNRYDEHNRPNTFANKNFQARFVQLSPLSKRLINANNIVDRAFIYSKAIDTLLGGLIDTILELLQEPIIGGKIDIDEYMFFLSAISDKSDISLSKTETIDLIKHYRVLSRTQRMAVDNTVKDYADPEHFGGNKKQKRDYGNWKNECQQIFNLLGQTVYLELFARLGKQTISLKTAERGQFKEVATRLNRSLAEKHKYFEKQKVARTPGFELHHVVSLGSSENLQHFTLLDKWQNMVYIDAYKHSLITQNGNRNVLMSFKNDDLLLSDYIDNVVELKLEKNILYLTTNKTIMQNYNLELIEYRA